MITAPKLAEYVLNQLL
jgi:hypothetical protein